ncbi:hypothetical protein HBA55_35850 [Pseudomaricurvus alkylphenolicus]|jgi:hypothetical protein|uniref:hypothetical protein n=1 Tax=Pseudomaricurvus alkylphenolicus TaxID=1306991 RepID=UPI0014200381|nr:hypothetical protein [Pseudomaricurvus alkylphenolicus]NIB45009.1 hypothetical protein [Pseudomaricurvus alkylphenolicus]
MKNILFTSLILLLSAVATQGARAGLIDMTTPVPGGAAFSSDVMMAFSSSDITFGGLGPFGIAEIPPATPFGGILTSGLLGVTGSEITAGAIGLFATVPPLPNPFLEATFLDFEVGDGFLRALMSVSGGSAATDYGSHVLLSFAGIGINQALLDNLSTQNSVVDINAQLRLSSVTVSAGNVPAPGILYLMLIGLMGWNLAHRFARKNQE